MSLHGMEFDDSLERNHVSYRLDSDELYELENDLFNIVEKETGVNEDIAVVWTDADSEFSNIVRTYEANKFPEIPKIVSAYEGLCQFLTVVDLRQGNRSVVHGARLSGKKDKSEVIDGQTGIPLIDDIINSDQNLDSETFLDYYENLGVDLENKALSVETTFRTKKTSKYNMLSIAEVSYLSIFNYLDNDKELKPFESVIFAHINRMSRASLIKAGVEIGYITDNDELMTPTPIGTTRYDANYTPIHILYSKENLDTFRELSVLAPPNINMY